MRSLFTLDLARRLHEKGHIVFGAETSIHHICWLSNAFEKHFVVPSPRFRSKRFIDSIVAICKKETIHLVIPTFEEIFSLAKGAKNFPPQTKLFCTSYEALDALHNKWRFNKKIETLGFDTPQSYIIQSQQDLNTCPLSLPYILKPSYSRAALSIQKINSTTPPQIKIDPTNPLVAQEWIHGKKYCSYSIAHQGNLAAHAVYPVDISIEGNACLNFEAIEHKTIYSWVSLFVAKKQFTGQIGFDFIETKQGKLYAIECNPRGTSGIHLFQQKDSFCEAFFNHQKSIAIPQIGYAKKLGWGMLLYGWKTRNLCKFIHTFIFVKDAIFSIKDIKPFFYQIVLFFVYLFRSLKLKAPIPAIFTFDIDWNGEEEPTTTKNLQKPICAINLKRSKRLS